MSLKTIFMLILAGVLTLVALSLYSVSAGKPFEINPNPQPPVAVTDFESCVAAGNAVMESYPRQCRDAEGELYVEQIDNPINTEPSTGACVVGGCSGQLCGEEGDDLISTCEWTESYACYRTAKCERQQSGECGWTQTEELNKCLMESSNGVELVQ